MSTTPTEWLKTRLKFALAETVPGGTPDTGDELSWTDADGTPWVAISDMTRSSLVTTTAKQVTPRGIAAKRLRLLPPGTLLYSMYASLGKVAILGCRAVMNQAILGLIPREEVATTAFLRWTLENLEAEVAAFASSNTQANLNAEKVRNLPVLLPPLLVQRAIADFLDRKTAAIDELIRKKERLIELLQEKRQALITQAVTKGLDPNVPMKDSGIEWLGEIPAHWKVVKNRALWNEVKARSETGDEELLTVSHITGVTPRKEKTEVTMFMAESHVGYKLCEPGDLVINTMWAWMGALGIAGESGMVSPSYNVYRQTRADLDPSFYDILARTSPHVSELTRWSKGIWTSRLRIYPSEFFQIHTPVPPLAEQQQIVGHVSSILRRDEALASRLQVAIDRLKEYRQSLISAAVTGQLPIPQAAP